MTKTPAEFDTQLASYATVRQLEYLEALEAHGSVERAALALAVAPATIERSLRQLRVNAAQRGYSPGHDMTRTVPEGFKLSGVSTLYDADGVIRGQWVKSKADDVAREAMMKAAFEAMAADLPRVMPTPAPSVKTDQLCNVFTLTDSHIGAMCWGQETGADWDLGIAEQVLTDCFQRMVLVSPKAKVAVVAELGDFLHQDGMSAVTPTSGHLLDASGRFEQVVQVAVRVLRKVIGLALERHELVLVLLAEGNHDISSSIWLRTMFKALYENEPRVQVIDSPLPYYVYQHGQTMLGWHHGHLKKNDQLPLLFASGFPKIWGDTTKRYAHCGHRHHVEEKEHSGMLVVQHPTLAARDAYAARGGWLAERQARAITYHKEFGEVGRMVVTPEMVA